MHASSGRIISLLYSGTQFNSTFDIAFILVYCIYVNEIQYINIFMFEMIIKLIGCWLVYSLIFRILKFKTLCESLIYVRKNVLGHY